MRIYTKTGDAGETGLFGGPRVPKDHVRIEAYGTIDELNAFLGAARAQGLPAGMDALLAKIQHELFAVGAELASPDPIRSQTRWINRGHAAYLEGAIDEFEGQLPPLRDFILPFGSVSSTFIHLARAVCRRAERHLVTLLRTPSEKVSEDLVIYLNRLGDLLFVLSRSANQSAGFSDEPWRKPEP